jgi:hypothetical protein
MNRTLRFWRVRRRHDHIDAVLRSVGSTWTLEYSRNDRTLVTRRYDTEINARVEARARLEELQRAGWIEHW